MADTPVGAVELVERTIGGRTRLVPVDLGTFDPGLHPLDLLRDDLYCVHDVFVGAPRSRRHYPCPWCPNGG